MTEKVVLTKEQAEAVEYFRKTFVENPKTSMSNEKLIIALNGNYEVEPEFKNDEWVVLKSGEIVQIHYVKDEIFEHASNIVGNTNGKIFSYDKGGDYWYGYDLIDRHATPSEIAEEKERQFFAEHGRKKWELKRGDILIDESGHTRIVRGTTDAHGYLDENKVHFVDGDWEIFEDVKKIYKVACFAEKRLDVNNND